jgi:predicted CoA-binding protein
MLKEASEFEEITLPQVVTRLQNIEEQVKLVNMRLQFQPELPRFEFVIEVDGETVWSGLDLQNAYIKLRQQYADNKLEMSWRSSPMVWI